MMTFFINSKITIDDLFDDKDFKIYSSISVTKRTFHKNDWSYMIKHSNDLLNKKFDEYFLHSYPSHAAYFFRKSFLKELYHEFQIDFDYTSQQKTRTLNDTVMVFLYNNYLTRKFLFNKYYYNSNQIRYYDFTRKSSKNKKNFKEISNKNKLFICINDNLEGNETKINFQITYFKNKMEKIYSNKTIFEI